jgi:hypothetical protein
MPLTVSFLSHKCSSLKIAIQFDNTATNFKEKSKPKVLMEFYGLPSGDHSKSPEFVSALAQIKAAGKGID